MIDEARPPRYRWVIEALLFVALFAQTVTAIAPAPILSPIMGSLHLSLGAAGLVVSIIALCSAVFSVLGALVVQRLGALRTLLWGIWLMALGQIASGYAATFATLLASRVLQGIGFGLMIAPPGALVMQWFGESEWPWINTVNWLSSYVGATCVYAVTVPMFYALHSSWQAVLFTYGLGVAAVALLWMAFGREHESAATHVTGAGFIPGVWAVREVLAVRDVVLVALATFGAMWVYQIFAVFLPQFFHDYHGLELKEASQLTAILPLAAIFAAAGGGFGTSWLGVRKPFTWPAGILMLLGGLGTLTASSIGGIRLSLIMFGVGTAASPPALTTLLMELPGMTPVKMGIGLALVWSAGYTGAFASPFLGGALATSMGLRTVMLGFLFFQLIPIATMYLLPETGPGGRTAVRIAPATGSD
jgi:predicted MFS family arabinose efflux permease